MTRLCVLTIILFLGVTEIVYAVRINEVAWMGSTENANHEWIELYNAAEGAVSLAGWSLTDGANLNIGLSGTIEATAYGILERTRSDGSSLGSILSSYSGALVNTGATLTLRNAEGVIVDQVAGGTNWQNIGGDNSTKETAQYAATGWVTDTPTPGAVNGSGRVTPSPTATTTTPTVPETTTGSGSNKSGSSRTSAVSVRLKNPETKMTITPDVQSVAYVNQSIPLKVDVSGDYEHQESMVRFVWNFGDLNTAEGRSVTHVYEYPGEYVVTVHAKNGKAEQVARHEIKVLPVAFSITKNERGDIQVHNNAPYDTDISGYTLKGSEAIVFPPRTIMLSRGTITIPKAKVGTGKLVALYDTKGQLVTSTYQELKPSPAVTEEIVYPAAVTVQTPAPTQNLTTFGFLTERAEASEIVASPDEVIVIEPNDTAVAAPPAEPSRGGYLGLISILGLSFLAILLFNRPANKSEA